MLTAEQLLILNELQYGEEKTELSEVIIDGNKISGYFEYSFFHAKTMTKSPERAMDGSMAQINSIPFVLTPRLRIKFSLMPIETYRTIMKLIYAKNEFTIQCYDIVYDRAITFKAYFDPEDFPELFMYGLKLLGAMNYEIILNGTNNEIDKANVTYHLNPPSSTGVSDMTFGSDDISLNTEFIVGEGCDFQTETFNGKYKFSKWNEESNGTGFSYVDGNVYTLNKSLILYAQWQSSSNYTLSFNYGLGETALDATNAPIYSRGVTYGGTYGGTVGSLPNTEAKKVTYNGNEYTPYVRRGWYQTPTIAEGSTEITAGTKYLVGGNSTIYQIFEPLEYTITFNSNGGNYTPNPTTQKYGTFIYEPSAPTKAGFTFDGWYTTSNFAVGTKFTFNTMPPLNITLYAKWVTE